MRHVFLDGLPGLADSGGTLRLHTRGHSACICSSQLIARLSLETGRVAWLIERALVRLSAAARNHPRRIHISGADLWTSEADDVLAELSPCEDGGVLVSARHTDTGRTLWEYCVSVPEAAEWAEPVPAWSGAQTEEIHAFFADDPTGVTVCLSRQSRRTLRYSREFTVNTLPPYACQTDAMRLDSRTGVPVWRASFPDIHVGILKRLSFNGIWSRGRRAGIVDFEAGTNRVLYESPHVLAWPVLDGSTVAVPWHARGRVGVTWLDDDGSPVRTGTWRCPRVRSTCLHATEAGLALQANEQTLWWLGQSDVPSWAIRAKPYIYRVRCCRSTDVFVGTDGRGGRLLAFDPTSGPETLNIKPALGGAGTLARIPGHEVLVARFCTSRQNSAVGSLLLLSMTDRSHWLDGDCRSLLGVWEHGAVYVAGEAGERLAIVDIR